jgi:hypothetical protein
MEIRVVAEPARENGPPVALTCLVLEGQMKHDAYEQAYYEARAVLHRRGKIIEKPAYESDGIRYCRVNGLLLSDRELLEDAWGDRLAEEILRERDVRLPKETCCARVVSTPA